MITGKLDPARFLAQFWQRRPLLIKGAFPGFADPITPEELAGLACEEGVDARIVFTRKKGWELKSGPFGERDFTTLPDRDWTLLVQAVDQWVPGVRELLTSVPFIPGWRVDDVMISYATPNGGVGPHFDYYDVFLVQGQGTRVWKTGQHCGEGDLLRTGSGLKLLKEFHTEDEWLLEPGDVLYVPPGVAHWGVSRDDSLCYSLGFRAPSLGDMLLGYGEYLADRAPADVRFADPARKLPLRSGEIDEASLRQARNMLMHALSDERAFAHWFGCSLSEAKEPDAIAVPRKIPDLSKSLALAVNPASRFCWQQHGDELLVFADGECYTQRASRTLLQLVQSLASVGGTIDTGRYRSKEAQALLRELMQQGSLVIVKPRAQKRKSR
ncbi:MAG TPA: cupin domain-containing protein [Pseudomonadales bacterium]